MSARIVTPHGSGAVLRCPICHAGRIAREDQAVRCCSSDCGVRFALAGDIPILLNESRSIFRATDFTGRATTTFVANGTIAERIGRVLPSPSLDVGQSRNYACLADVLRERAVNRRRVLVVGCGDGTAGYRDIELVNDVVIVETDVSLAGRATMVCDASDLPFEDEQFDVIICQAVLEHVLEPQRCVDEMHRVLRPDGVLYATTPFMQHVHMGAYDFTRFTRSGHRWLFRRFSQMDAGIATGPASMLVWSVEYFFLAFTASIAVRRVIKALVRLGIGWLTVLDRWLATRASALDSAGGFYFLGRKAPAETLTARDILDYYAGADQVK